MKKKRKRKKKTKTKTKAKTKAKTWPTATISADERRGTAATASEETVPAGGSERSG